MMRIERQIHWGSLWVFMLILLTSATAWSQTISFSLQFPRRGVRDRGHFVQMLSRQLRTRLVRKGFVVSRSRVRKGFHLQLRISVAEELGADDPASSSISVNGRILMFPERRVVAHDISSSGSGRYQRAAKMDRTKIRRLRTLAVHQVTRFLASNLRPLFRQIQAKLRSLKKGEYLGKKVRSVRARRSYKGSGRSSKALTGRPLPGRSPLLQLTPANTHRAVSRPPFRPIK